MKRIRQGLGLLLCGLLLFPGGCAGEETGGGAEVQAAAQAAARAVQAAEAALSGAESLRVVYATEIRYSILKEEEGQEDTLTIHREMDMSLVTGAESALRRREYTHMFTGSGEERETDYTLYVVQEDGAFWQYATDGTNWLKTTVESGSPDQVDLSAFFRVFRADETSYRQVGEETAEGRACVKYQGTIRGEDLVAFLETGGLLEAFSNMSDRQQEKIRENLKEAEGIPVYLWLDAEEGWPVRCEAALTGEALEQLRANVSATLGGYEVEDWQSILDLSMTMTVSDYGRGEKILLPPEAAGAEQVDLSGEEEEADRDDPAEEPPAEEPPAEEEAPGKGGGEEIPGFGDVQPPETDLFSPPLESTGPVLQELDPIPEVTLPVETPKKK